MEVPWVALVFHKSLYSPRYVATCDAIPITYLSLLNEEVSFLFLHENKEFVLDGITKTLTEFHLGGGSRGGEGEMVVQEKGTLPPSKLIMPKIPLRRYGDVVEAIQMANAPPRGQALWAIVVFRSPANVDAILKGEDRVRFVIKRKHVWARLYAPRDQE
ncbi:hypothetical protein FRX31_012109 [Thalictrum thalictroides]|uniref:Uncharacterized protein n=1 Tax=Thalictrum thalictroides TaxID=46969 RepID=A0A7J6WLP9_THATH|nr:hypothetical protein FRX31_012109 [Thalictrum thalictroides]